MLRKGMGSGTIMKLTLALMTAGLFISVGTLGSIGQAIEDGFGMIDENTDYTIELGENGKAKLSNATQFVYDRAQNNGCKDGNGVDQKNNNGGYPGLEGTYMTQKPKCLGASRAVEAVGESGQDMEGIFSRVSFEVKEKVKIDTSENSVWLEEKLNGLVKGGYIESTDEVCDETYQSGASTLQHSFDGQSSEFTAFFATENPESRGNKFLDPNSVYCEGNPKDNFNQNYNGNLEMILCPGDEGYIQMNKKTPQNDGESGTSGISNRKYGHIVITEQSDENCGVTTRVPSPHNLKGNVFYVDMDAGESQSSGYPWFRNTAADHNIDILDLEPGTTTGAGIRNPTYDVYPPEEEDRCEIAIYDNDAGGASNGERGYAMFDTGVKIEKDGSLPSLGNAEAYDFNPVNNIDMSPDPNNARDVYEMVASSTRGFNGNEGLGPSGENTGASPYLDGFNTDDTNMELQGDLLCVQDDYSGADHARWIMCDPRLSEMDVTASVNGEDYECKPGTGNWELD